MVGVAHGNVYFFRTSIDDPNAAPVIELVPLCGGSSTVALTGVPTAPTGAVWVDGDSLYWSDRSSPPTVYRKALGGLGPIETVLRDTDWSFLGGLERDACNLYWAEWSPAGVQLVARKK